ncbi:PAS domain S-box protein [Methylocystis sp.]
MNRLWVVSWTTDCKGLCTYVDPCWLQITGQSAESARGEGWFETIHPDDLARVKIDLDLAARAERAFQVAAQLRRQDGQFRWALAVGAPRYDAQRAFVGYSGSIIDFQDRMIAERELADTRQRLEAIMDAAPVGLCYTSDLSCAHVVGNKALLAQFEFEPAQEISASAAAPEAAGRRIRYLKNGREMADAELPLQSAMREARVIEPEEIEVLLPSGRRWFSETSAAPIFSDGGRLLGGVAVTVDITERKETEAALHDSEERFRALVLASSDAVYRMSSDWGELRQLVGRDFIAESTTPSQTWIQKYILPEDQLLVMKAISEAIRAKNVFELEHRFKRIDGSIGWTQSRAIPILDASREITEWFGMARDITERKQAEETLRWHMRRSELLSETAAQLLASDDPQLLVDELCNKVMAFLDCDLFFNYLVDEDSGRLRLNASGGISEDWLHRLEWREFGADCGCVDVGRERIIAEDIQNRTDLRTERVKSFGIRAYCCHPILHHDRVIGTLSFGTRSRAHFSADEVAVMKAVTDLVAIAIRRAETEQTMREADRRKDEFIATLAHELRNPLAPIRNAAHILKTKYGPDFPDTPLFDMIGRQVDHLVRLVEDLLEVSRIRRGKIELHRKKVALQASLRDALESCQPLIDAKAHRVVLNVAAEPIWLFGDPVRLAQIAANIINNAAKYTPPGGRIDVEAARAGDEAVLRVRDTGVGISADMMPRVFDLFAQTEGHIRLSDGGLGIGLALVRKLVELHGGHVEAHSDGVGRGSEFVVRLPLGEEPASAAPQSANI